jgi:DnaK suppressor protein
MSDRTSREDQQLRDELLPRIRQELDELRDLSVLTETDRAPVQLDQQSVGRLSRMDAMQGQALSQASDLRRKARIVALDAALRRFDEGEFGYCADCGEPIAMARLKVDLATTLCIACAHSAER